MVRSRLVLALAVCSACCRPPIRPPPGGDDDDVAAADDAAPAGVPIDAPRPPDLDAPEVARPQDPDDGKAPWSWSAVRVDSPVRTEPTDGCDGPGPASDRRTDCPEAPWRLAAVVVSIADDRGSVRVRLDRGGDAGVRKGWRGRVLVGGAPSPVLFTVTEIAARWSEATAAGAFPTGHDHMMLWDPTRGHTQME